MTAKAPIWWISRRRAASRAVLALCAALLLAPPFQGLAVAKEPAGKLHLASFALYGAQTVFQREANVGTALLRRQLNITGQKIVRVNNRSETNAKLDDVKTTIARISAGMDRQNDIAVLFFTTHGSKEGLAIVSGTDDYEANLSPGTLSDMLEKSGIKYKILIISACYSGVFADRLAGPDTLVITAADSEHSSFGCDDTRRLTYFGQGLFEKGLARTGDLRAAFNIAAKFVAALEEQQGFQGSNPQFRDGEQVLNRLEQITQHAR